MKYINITGNFYVVNHAIDGDTAYLIAHNPQLWKEVPGRSISPNSRGEVSVRIDGIDALETHYKGIHQPLALANASSDRLLKLLGVTGVLRKTRNGPIQKANDGVAGYLLANHTGAFGRPTSLVYAGDSIMKDGSRTDPKSLHVQRSINARLLEEGCVYPLFYHLMPSELREIFASIVQLARTKNLGVWRHDRSMSGFNPQDLAALQLTTCIVPRLFRIIADYHRSKNSWRDFGERLKRIPVTVVPDMLRTNLRELVEFRVTHLRLTVPPEQMVFGGRIST